MFTLFFSLLLSFSRSLFGFSSTIHYRSKLYHFDPYHDPTTETPEIAENLNAYLATQLPGHFDGGHDQLPTDDQFNLTDFPDRVLDWNAAKKAVYKAEEFGGWKEKDYEKNKKANTIWESISMLNELYKNVPHSHVQDFWKADVEFGREMLSGVHPTRYRQQPSLFPFVFLVFPHDAKVVLSLTYAFVFFFLC